jgi:hypothetical protein
LWGILLLLLLVLPLRASAEGFEQELDDLHERVLGHCEDEGYGEEGTVKSCSGEGASRSGVTRCRDSPLGRG